MTAILFGAALLLGPNPNLIGQEQSQPAQVVAPGDHSFLVKVGDLDRRYIVHVPPSYDGKKVLPVVIMFHGAGGTARGAMRQTGWTSKADQAGFLAVFPEGMSRDPSKPSRFAGNPQVWNDGSGRGHAGRRNIDDVGFVKALMDDVLSRFAVNGQRVYATGFSNGASMTFRLGVELSNRIAAIAPVSGYFWLKTPKPEHPVPLIYMIGTEDPVNPLEGGKVRRPGGRIITKPSARDSVLKWAEMLGCERTPKIIYDKEGVKGTAYGPCKEGAEVITYTIGGMGHTWPGGKSRLPEWMVGKTSNKLIGTDVIWGFFDRHPKK